MLLKLWGRKKNKYWEIGLREKSEILSSVFSTIRDYRKRNKKEALKAIKKTDLFSEFNVLGMDINNESNISNLKPHDISQIVEL